MRPTTVVVLMLMVAACSPQGIDSRSTSEVPSTSSPTSEPTTTSSTTTLPPLATIPILPHTTIDPSTMTGKLLMGYQGWFTCPGDGSGIDGDSHWIQDGSNIIDAAGYRPDMWPDMAELTEEERCPTDLTYPDGSPAYLYSSSNYNTVLRHFQWMSEYGVDGVFLQRFGSQLIYRDSREQRNQLTEHMREAADSYARVWAIMYDVTGTDERPVDLVETFQEDWKYLVDVMGVTDSPTYLHHEGLPVVAIWGLGFEGRPGTPEEALELVDFFQNNPDSRYRATLVGGVPFLWRTLEPNAQPDPAWAGYYCALDVISPWTVGAYGVPGDVDFWQPTMIADIAAAADCDTDFMPVVYPGHSYHNPDPSRPFNEYPRHGGRLYWHQVFRAIQAGAPMVYNAMFDEIDESTAMYKVAATSAQVPTGLEVVTMDVDGECLPSDWYLTLAGEASKMLRGEIPLTEVIPVTPTSDEAC